MAKANLQCYNPATLSLYHFLGVLEPIRPCFNDIRQRWWFGKVIIGFLHELVHIRVKPINFAHLW